MKRIIIITHATYAKGIYEAAKFIIGGVENVYIINSFTESEFPEKEFVSLLERFENNDKVVVLTDLKGGSVNQFVSKHMKERKFHLITGVNLGTVIEIMVKNEDDITEESIRQTVIAGKNDLVYMNDEIEKLSEIKNNEEDFFV